MVRIRGRRGWPGRGAGHRPGQAFHRDERGGTAVTAIVFLPVIILSPGMLIVL